MAKKKTAKSKAAKEPKEEKAGVSEDGKLWAILTSVILILFFIPLWIVKPRDSYSAFYAKQAFLLLIASIVVSILGGIPIIGTFIIGPIGGLLVFILWIWGIVNSASGKQKPLPVIGKWAEDWFKSL